jgi:hypothetical protein
MDADAYVDLLPWMLFMVVDRKQGLGLGWAGASAALCAGGLLAWAYWHGRRNTVAALGSAVFGALGVLGALAAPWLSHHDAVRLDAARSGAVLVLGIACLASVRSTPLSYAYSAGRVQSQMCGDPRFAAVNARITRSWGLGALVVAASYAVPAFWPTTVVRTVFDWVVPLVVTAGVVKWSAERWEAFRLQLASEWASKAGSRPLAASVDFSDDGAEGSGDAVVHSIERWRRSA